MQLRLHNTLTRRKDDFRPIDPNRVRLYVCGPTVYQRIHVGNARAFVVFDVLFRLLRHLYGADHVVYVRNITDIDDKIIDQAAQSGEDIRALTDRTAAQFQEDLAALGCLPPTHEPRATEHVPGMIALIEELIARGHAYAAEGHVLFSVPSMPAYGRLSGRNRDEQIAGARIDVAPYKRDPADFVLWKPSAGDQPGWDSPWGHGRPGWHIECSAMSEAFLAPLPFDIHAGGLDLIFPHHENEIAQSEGANGTRFVDTWMHNGFLNVDNVKMSKSLGNFFTIRDVLKHFDGETLRFFMLRTHYRSPFNFSDANLEDAKSALRRLYTALDGIEVPSAEPDWSQPQAAAFRAAMNDDFNTPVAFAVLFDLAGELNRTRSPQTAALLKGLAATVGILQQAPRAFLQGGTGHDSGDAAWIDERIAARAAAKAARDFARADAIRKELADRGIVLKDSPQGTTWVKG